ncbi:MAG: 4Fe-4S binding protein [Prevotella sp.]|nr:4Fe-4S binding protein [Prevotella sp.]
MLRKIRIILATVIFLGIMWLFLDFTGTARQWVSWMPKLQFLEAVLAGSVVIVFVLTLLTLCFGRLYCSVICPLGIMQDIIGWLGKKQKKNRYSYSKAVSWLRYTMLGVFGAGLVLSFFAGIGLVVQLLAPYSAFGRIATNLLQPLYTAGNNLLAGIAESYDSYLFYHEDVWLRSLPSLIIAVLTLVILFVLAWRNGRTYCNTICPVGTVLSFAARFSWLKIHFDADKCRNCSLCSKNCKAACIDYKNHSVDYSRCVVCGDCIESCKFGALRYGRSNQNTQSTQNNSTDSSRRAFLIGTALASTAVLAQEKKKVDGGLATIAKRVIPERQTPLTPPGSLSAQNMASHCTGCQLCVSECPNQVLRPSTSLLTMMQPTMSYERGYCRPECTRCSEVCPAGAIKPITPIEKSSIQIGHAVWIRQNCVSVNDGVSCGNCARHCPTGAIEMVPLDPNDGDSPLVPAISETRCIGCGACEHLCPGKNGQTAIMVEGHEVHREV